MTSSSLRIAIAGLGTVGAGVVTLIQTHGDRIARLAGKPVEIVAVSAKDKTKNRGIDLTPYDFVENPLLFTSRPDVDVIVELIGGEDGVAKNLLEQSLSNKKHVVTANKALLAKHGLVLAQMAESKGVCLSYEAAVAGGIPIIKAMKEGFAANDIDAVYGILNGTCNYILSQMQDTGRDFADVLAEAQEKGYAERDPSFDIDGIDAAHKLCLLTTLAFGVKPRFDQIDMTGIRAITARDIGYARELGYTIKLLGRAQRIGGKIMQTVEPCLVRNGTALAAVHGVFNAVHLHGDFVGHAMAQGRGAGAGPTASAVVADLIDLARGNRVLPFGLDTSMLTDPVMARPEDIHARHYLHLQVLDQPGVIADLAAILKTYNISIESFIQRGRDPGQVVSVVLMIHETSRSAIRQAVNDMEKIPSVTARPTVLSVVDL